MEENTTWFLFLLDLEILSISMTCKNYLRERRKKCGSFWPLLVKARSVQKVHIPIVQVIETTLIFWYHLKTKKLAYQTFFFWMWWFTPDSESIFSWLQYIEKIEQLHLKIYTIYIFCFIFGMHNIKELLIFLKYKNKLT